MLKNSAKILRSITFFSLLMVAGAGSASAVDRDAVRCAEATPIAAGSTLRSFGDAGAVEVFELQVPSAGIVSLDVAARRTAAEPRVLFLGRGCAAAVAEDAGFFYLQRSASTLVLGIQAPGTYRFRVAAQDRFAALGEYKVRAAFAAAAMRDEDPSEDELEPFGGRSFCPGQRDEDPSEDELEPFGGRSYDLSAGVCELRSALVQLCRSGEVDDHGESPACATGLTAGQPVAGELGNSWGDDDDVFVFALDDQRTVRIETAGGSDTFGGLYDRFGQRLGQDDDSGTDGGFRLVKTLSPGTYFVRVEGSGAYSLSLSELDW